MKANTTSDNILYLQSSENFNATLGLEINKILGLKGNDLETIMDIKNTIELILLNTAIDTEDGIAARQAIGTAIQKYFDSKINKKPENKVILIDTEDMLYKYIQHVKTNFQINSPDKHAGFNPFRFFERDNWTVQDKARLMTVFVSDYLHQSFTPCEEEIIRTAFTEMYSKGREESLEELYRILSSEEFQDKDYNYKDSVSALCKILDKNKKKNYPFETDDMAYKADGDCVIYNLLYIPDLLKRGYVLHTLEYILNSVASDEQHTYIYVPYTKDNFPDAVHEYELLNFCRLASKRNASIVLYGERLLFNGENGISDEAADKDAAIYETALLNNANRVFVEGSFKDPIFSIADDKLLIDTRNKDNDFLIKLCPEKIRNRITNQS